MEFKTAKCILKKHESELQELGIKQLFIFGSTAREEANLDSDVDVLVNFDAKKGLFTFIRAKRFLEEILECKVDLVSKKGIHPALKERIFAEAKNVF